MGIALALALSFLQMTKEEAVRLGSEALAHQLGVSVDLVELRRATPTEWPDSALGCPKEGESYLQAVTPGFLLTLQADGQVYAVHAGGGRAVVCGRAMRAAEGATPKESYGLDAPIDLPEAPMLRELVLKARSDLAEKLVVSPEAIELLEIREMVWPDASLGCPRPGKEYPQVMREGHLIRLRFEERVYRYHSGQGGAPFLCESPAPKRR